MLNTCKVCGTEFETSKSRGPAKYCSKKCMYARNDTSRPCEVCGELFRSPPSQMHVKTCSTECGYKIRVSANKKEKIELECWQCRKKYLEHESHADRRVYCSTACMSASEQLKQIKSSNMSGANNPGWGGGVTRHGVSSSGKEYRRSQAHVEAEKIVRRQRVKNRATPAWADIEKIREIYRVAQRLSKTTGVKYHVDHIVPLKSNQVSGLHCEANLQVIPATANLKKHNRSWPHKP